MTLPKVTAVEQVEALVHAAERLEAALGLGAGALRFEIQVETPQSILGPDGTALVARMVHASAGRCTGLHYGTYDYSAYCGIAAAQQSLEHPVADHAKAVMQAAAAGTGVRLSDGSTNVLPVGSPDEVRAAWANHLRLVRRSLERGYYQGWDLHPAQLPTRFAATFAFYREGWAAAAARLRTYVERRESGVLDEPATARALADFLLRGPRLRRADGATRSTRRPGSTRGPWGHWRTAPPRLEADDMGIVLGPNRYGKAENRVVRIVRDTPRHEIRDLNVSTSLRGDFAAAHTDGDQSQVLPTDTQKNTAFAYAKKHGVTSPEDYALALGRPAARGDPGRARVRRCGSRSTPGTASRSTARATTTPSYAAAARCAPRRSTSRAAAPTVVCRPRRTWSC